MLAQPLAARPSNVAIWLREVRVPFFTASVVPVALGVVVAWYETARFNVLLFLLTLLGAVLAHAASNMINDYYDHRSGNDTVNRFRSPFNGGAGLIQEGLLTPRQVFIAALTAFAAAAAIGLYLAWVAGPWILVPMVLGGLFAFFYTGEPLRLAYYGIGEVLIGLSFGPLLVAGSYMVQTGTLSLGAAAASLPVGLLIAAVLYINQFPDYEADKAVGKAHWVVRLGTERAVPWLGGLLFAAVAWVVAMVLFGITPWPAVFAAAAAVPMSLRAYGLCRKFHASPLELRPANALVIGTHLVVGLLVTAGFLAAGLLGV